MSQTQSPPVQVVVMSPNDLRELLRDVVFEVMQEWVEDARKPLALLDRGGLAQALGCSTTTISKLLRDGCPSVRLGDVHRFKLDEVLAWLKQRKTAQTGARSLRT
jgi:excisionase family DNA binding protein